MAILLKYLRPHRRLIILALLLAGLCKALQEYITRKAVARLGIRRWSADDDTHCPPAVDYHACRHHL